MDRKIADMRTSFGEIGDMRLTVMASIVLADELADANNKITAANEKVARLQNSDQSAVAASEEETSEAVEVVDNLAERLEVLAADLRTRLRGGAGA